MQLISLKQGLDVVDDVTSSGALHGERRGVASTGTLCGG